jgi:class 3 adenylate cyclase/tetratricopeptide (TPR) repeat protein
VRCGRCGTTSAADQGLCPQCGHVLAPDLATALAVFDSPRNYTPRYLAERIMGSRGAIEGERKQVTVMFCDLVDSTALAERVGPETMHAVLRRFFELSLDEVHRYEGTVNQFLGDGFMALFGAPLAHEDDPVRAALAALAIRTAVAHHRPELAARYGTEIEVRLALNTGVVVVGSIGDNLRLDYTAVGDTTNLAARLLAHAPPGGILATQATARLLAGHVRTEAVAPLPVKGKREPVAAYRILSAIAHAPLVDARSRALGPFVGRERELEALAAVVRQVEAGHGQAVGISGEPGVGKSRLLYEVERRLAERDFTCLDARCLSYGQSTPYLPVVDLVRSRCRIRDGDRADAVADRVTGAVEETGADPGEMAPFLLRILGLQAESEQLDRLGPETIRARTFDALRRLLVSPSRRTPLVIAVEDYHWIDRTSADFFDHLVDSIAAAPVLLVTTYRPGYGPRWLDRSVASELTLHPLTPDESHQVVQALAGAAPLGEATTGLILSKAEGNPFFLEELTRAVIEHGLGAPLAIPDTIQGVLMARIDRLPEEAKGLLQVASILGREVSLPLLAAVWGDEASLPRCLQDLTRLGFVVRQAETRETTCAFTHALTQEVAYESLLTRQREALHESVAHALEGLDPDRQAEFAELLAYHYTRSTNLDKAVEYLSLANQKAARANAVVEAESFFGQAMALLEHLPDSPANRARRVALLVGQAIVIRGLFKADEYYKVLLRHEDLALSLQDPGLLASYYGLIGWCEWSFGEFDRAIATLGKAAALGEAARNAQATSYAYAACEFSHLFRGDYDAVFALRARAVELAGRALNVRSFAWSLAAASWAAAFRGQWSEAIRDGEEALRTGQQFSDDSVVSFSALTLSLVCNHQGDPARALRYAEMAVERAPTPADKMWSETFRAWTWCRAGEARHGVEILADQIPRYRAARFMPSVVFTQYLLGEGYWRAGDLDRARQALTECLELGERCGARFVTASAHRFLAEVALAEGPAVNALPRAAFHFEQSIARLRDIGAENELAMAYAGYGRLRHRQGRAAEARDYLGRALAILERLNTLAEPDRVRAELAQLPAT